MSVVDNERPPYVTFERRAVEDRAASIAQGHYVAKDVDFAVIMRPGSRDVLEVEALQWLASMAEKAKGGLVPVTWVKLFNSLYSDWLTGETSPENGTPIKTWPVLSPAARETIIRAGYRTVEDLAAGPDNEVIGIGTGGIQFKMKAKAWLEAAKNNGIPAEQLAGMQQKIDELTALTQQLIDRNKELERLIPKEDVKAGF